ncbi:hypothetical protein [Methanofollis sp. UBA420]|jgi:hypothetical protein|uniref:hypothetical protein n=1 Tax=Methanofollis sp. UBA420 TaxID=1915514 RepID=UPI00316AE869
MDPSSKAPAFLVAAIAVILVSIGAASIYADLNSGQKGGETGAAIREVIPDIGDADLERILACDVCAAYGRVGEGQDLLSVLQAAGPELEPYLYPEGPVYSYGITYPGCIQIFLDGKTPANHSTTDTIYQVVERHGRGLGVKSTPVIFARTPFANRTATEEMLSPPWMKGKEA